MLLTAAARMPGFAAPAVRHADAALHRSFVRLHHQRDFSLAFSQRGTAPAAGLQLLPRYTCGLVGVSFGSVFREKEWEGENALREQKLWQNITHVLVREDRGKCTWGREMLSSVTYPFLSRFPSNTG